MNFSEPKLERSLYLIKKKEEKIECESDVVNQGPFITGSTVIYHPARIHKNTTMKYTRQYVSIYSGYVGNVFDKLGVFRKYV